MSKIAKMWPWRNLGVRHSVKSFIRRLYVKSNTKQLQGPRRFNLGKDEVALILLGRNIMHSASYILQYYRARGIRHFIYLDNGSSDGSELFFSEQPDAIVAQCFLNFRNFQPELRHLVATNFAVGGWRLAVDADELFDYPCSEKFDIPALVKYLNSRGYTGFIAQMLEMVPRGSLRTHDGKTFTECVEEFRFFSTSNVQKSDYHSTNDPLHFFAEKNSLSNQAIKIMRGGLRKTLFGEDCLLTKHVLFKCDRNVLPLPHPHFSCGLHLADFSGVLYHYKFAGPYVWKEKALERERRLSHQEGKARLAALNVSGDVIFESDDLCQNPSHQDLIDRQFIVPSPHLKSLV